MEKEKIGFLEKIDMAAEKKSNAVKTLWQIVKFLIVSCGVFIVQLALANLLPLIFDNLTATLPGFLQVIFVPEVLFDESTESGKAQFAKYVVNGVVTWGYVLPFFFSNALANVVGYIENKKRTFKSDAPTYCFVIYIFLLCALILFSTWFQGFLFGVMLNVGNAFLSGAARTIAVMAVGMLQMLILFPMEKFVLLREKKEDADVNTEVAE